MGKLHELLAVEDTVTSAAEKLMAETNEKFNKHTEFFSGHVRTLARINKSPEDEAAEAAQRREKTLPTTVGDTLAYIFPFWEKALNVKLSKHLTNQVAVADIVLDEVVIAKSVPVDFLLDMEKLLPRWRAMFATMPTLDPSRQWALEREGVWKADAPKSAQTEKTAYAVVLHPGEPNGRPAQVKEATKDVIVGTFSQVDFSGAATSQQKADVLALCDRLIVAVKQARMRANSIEQVKGEAAGALLSLFKGIFNTQ